LLSCFSSRISGRNTSIKVLVPASDGKTYKFTRSYAFKSHRLPIPLF
jgi:hypothetical protein